MINQKIRLVYLLGIGGIAMGTLATMLKESGFQVAGSDQNLYPPMSTHLESLGVPVCLGYKADNIRRFSPDMVIVGNVIRRDNPEAQFILENHVPYLSMPEAISEFFLKARKSIVAAGTHGKSTIASLLTWVLTESGMDPSAFVGAFMNNGGRSYRLGHGDHMVLEGDEYDTAFFDKVPKFIHYNPHVGIISSIEYDHADIYPDFQSVLKAFERFVQLIPSDGCLVINADDPNCVSLSRNCPGPVVGYGSSMLADWRLLRVDYLPERVCVHYHNPLRNAQETLVSNLPGLHNAYNTLAVMAASAAVGIPPESLQNAVLRFRGVRRRQDVLGESKGILVIDDFAHHPTAVQQTIHALKLFYRGRRIIAAFEPRSNSSRRSVFQDAYATAFQHADCVCIKEPPGMEAIPQAERLDTKQLVGSIKKKQKETYLFATTEEMLTFLSGYCLPGDLFLSMSNGSFDGLPHRFLEILENGASTQG